MEKLEYPTNVNLDVLNNNLQALHIMALPFPVAYIWSIYGEPKAKPEEGPVFYGGWAANAERVKAMVDVAKITPDYPDGWLQVERPMQNGDKINALLTRTIYAAPIGYRAIWRSENGGAAKDYQEGYRHHLQILALVATVSPQKTALPWAMAVITAKGFQASWVLQAIKDWSYMMGEAKNIIDPNIPDWSFFVPLGTFGQERRLVTVGGDHPKKLTMNVTYTPAELSTRIKLLERLYIGYAGIETVSSVANDPRVQAWLKAWDNPINEVEPEAE